MALITLGLGIGHDSACAVVRDGILIAACQQERLTRRKHDGHTSLSSQLPIENTLRVAGLCISDIDVIVTSFQSACPGGVGLDQPLWTSKFTAFDPFDRRHFVISHHTAHALSSFGLSGFTNAAALVCDLAGSTTIDGQDFESPFKDYYDLLVHHNPSHGSALKTEHLSFYNINQDGVSLLDREYASASSVNDVTIYGLASLYENVSRFVFGNSDAHGQLMALASLSGNTRTGINVEDILSVCSDNKVTFLNSWQSKTKQSDDPLEQIGLAKTVQNAFTMGVLSHARRLRKLSSNNRAVFSGGVFLNIPGNSAVLSSDIFDEVYFPSSPHDAGIAIGCAFAGQKIWRNPRPLPTKKYWSDRVGRNENWDESKRAIISARPFVQSKKSISVTEVAKDLQNGAVVARFSGRAEFGPRALGGRSLLASPLIAASKQRLNDIKGRQAWRPVAPIVLASRFSDFFTGPAPSPSMNFLHRFRDDQTPLLALRHADGSTRVQTLDPDDDPELHALISEFGSLTGFPILVNTSFNGRSEPIVDTADQAINMLRLSYEIDYLLLGAFRVERDPYPFFSNHSGQVFLSPSVLIAPKKVGADEKTITTDGLISVLVSDTIKSLLLLLVKPIEFSQIQKFAEKLDQSDRLALRRLFDAGFIKLSASSAAVI